MAGVYIARAVGVAGFERLVAMKVLHPHLAHEEEFISMFLDEARLAARIRHPNVVATQDISDTEGDGFFLVMDYVEGDHLGSLLGKSARQGKRIPQPITARLLIDALTGLAAAHQLTDENGDCLNIVHRDISPHNILVGTDGIGRLTDFGVAKAEVRMSSTRAGQFKGKLSYMAPEQASTGNCDQRSDLFAMGIILWESLTARRLFRGESNAATLSKILVDPIPLPSEVSPELEPWDAVLAKALARDPNERYQTADEFAEAIELTATKNEGIATARAVSGIVRELVGEKVEEEQRKVKSAIALSTSAASGTQARVPIPSSASQVMIPTAPTQSRIVARDMPLPGEHTGSGQVVVVQEDSRKTSVLLITALILVAAAAGIAGYFASRGSNVPQQVVVQAPPPAPTPAAAPEPTPEPTPAPAAVAPTPDALDPAAAAALEPAPTTETQAGGSRRTGGRTTSSGGSTATTAAAPPPATTVAAPPPPPPPPPPSSSAPIEDNPYR